MKKISEFISIFTVCALLIGFGAAFWLLPDKPLSEMENRMLTERPQFTVNRLLSGEYTEQIGTYFADQFPARDAFVGLKAYAELALLKGENNGVLLKDGHLIPLPGEVNDTQLERNVKSMSVFAEAVSVPVYVAATPRSVDVFSEKLPAAYPRESANDLYAKYHTLSEAYGLPTVDLFTPLCESGDYYRTDHHYTTDGAYLCYLNLADRLGYTPYDWDYFTLETASDSFCGTSMRSSGFYLTRKDTITLYRYPSDGDYRVIIKEDGRTINGFYDFDALSATDQYAVFLGGNHGRADVILPDAEEERPKLLMIRDSFADCLVPFLALHYDITLLDLRYYRGNIQKTVAEEGFDAVLIYQCLSEFDQNIGFGYLERKFIQEEKNEKQSIN